MKTPRRALAAEAVEALRLERTWPHGRCGELIAYADALPAVIEKAVGKAKAADLGKALHSGYAVEQLAIQLKDVLDREPHLAQIEEASGKFRALANLVRAGA